MSSENFINHIADVGKFEIWLDENELYCVSLNGDIGGDHYIPHPVIATFSSQEEANEYCVKNT